MNAVVVESLKSLLVRVARVGLLCHPRPLGLYGIPLHLCKQPKEEAVPDITTKPSESNIA